MISIALCTFNGERFLPEQLASILQQSRRPDEVLICDDRSTDNTIAVLREYAASSPFPVHVHVNAENLGSTTNFAKAIGLCTGDIIVLSDQDDIWRPDKLASIELAFDGAPEAGVIFSDATMIDEVRTPLNYGLWDAIEFGPGERRQFEAGAAFDCLLRRFRVTGATMAFRSRFRDLVLPIPPGWIHDAWIALLISAVAPIMPLEKRLIAYRQHTTQQLGERKRSWLGQYRVARAMGGEEFRSIAERFTEAHTRLSVWPGVSSERLQVLVEKIAHAEARARMRERTWRLPSIVREWHRGNYARFSRGWKAIAQDLFLP